LNLGWIMYGSDWNDALIGNWPYANTPGIPTVNWVAGIMDWSANPDNTNRDLLVDPSAGLMASYVKSAGVYHCPWDGSVSDAGPRVRSYSMNGFLGNSSTNGPVFTGWKQCSKVGDLRRPAQTIVLADEHENSIDDGFFFNDPARVKEWMDLPAARHNGAASLGFADGHAEIHRWSEASTKQPAIRGGPKPSVRIVGRETGADLAWVIWRG
jgi:prepilin-type processing-associated H-X9-DG protein